MFALEPSAFGIFSKAARPLILERYPNASPEEIGRHLTEWWHDLTLRQKVQYVAEAKKELDRYKQKAKPELARRLRSLSQEEEEEQDGYHQGRYGRQRRRL